MRARCSQGLGVETYAGNFMVRPTNDLSVAGIDSDKSILIYLKYEDKLQPNQICHIQCAMLYTSFEGVRYIRVFNT